MASAKENQPQRPTLLQPPATIISPPSPTDLRSSHSSMFPSPPQTQSPSSSSDDEDVCDSPESDPEIEYIPQVPSPRRTLSPRPPSRSTEPAAATQFSASPATEAGLLHPDSPLPQSPGASSSRLPTPASPRSTHGSPRPSSPQFRLKPDYNRRESSTHRVRETISGEQKSTSEGRMVNQYKIGKSLGSGAYATVELGVDVGTGTEYAIKEFSKSRLHYQALQQKNRQGTRTRVRRQGGSPVRPNEEGKRKLGEDLDAEKLKVEGAGGGQGGPWGHQDVVGSTEEKDPLGLIRREVAVMKKLDHPNIVQLYEAISVPNADGIFLVLEYMPGGTLMDVKMGDKADDATPPFEIHQTREYFRQLCLGLEYLHENEVVHRDIKPDNILLSADRQTLKLCDFGVSEMFTNQQDDRIKKSGGSPAFLSPESFSSHMHEVHGKAVDIWALGITLYCMLTGKLPFNVKNPMDLFDVVKEQDVPQQKGWSEELQDLIRKMLEKDPDKRIGVQDIKNHPWVTDNGNEPMISTDDNLFYVGKHVGEPTQEELRTAIGSFSSVFTVIRAAQKMRRLQLHRRTLSSQSSAGRPPSPFDLGGDSSHPSQSGSMDSYASQGRVDTDGTSAVDDADGDGDDAKEKTASPGGMSDDDGATEREGSGDGKQVGKGEGSALDQAVKRWKEMKIGENGKDGDGDGEDGDRGDRGRGAEGGGGKADQVDARRGGAEDEEATREDQGGVPLVESPTEE